jgi:hypothetical protein
MKHTPIVGYCLVLSSAAAGARAGTRAAEMATAREAPIMRNFILMIRILKVKKTKYLMRASGV